MICIESKHPYIHLFAEPTLDGAYGLVATAEGFGFLLFCFPIVLHDTIESLFRCKRISGMVQHASQVVVYVSHYRHQSLLLLLSHLRKVATFRDGV